MTNGEKGDIIIFDEQCRFCTRFANWARRSNPSFTILPVRSREARTTLHSKGVQFISLNTIYFVSFAGVKIKSKAVFEIFRNLNYPLRLFSVLRFLPAKFTDFFYSLFAKYRYKV